MLSNCFASLLALFLLSSAAAAPTAYEVLQSFDFPVGILPQGVTHYDLERSSGKFNAYLNGACSFSLDAYQLKYKSRISGNIYRDKLTNLSGVTVKVLFLWLKIVEVRKNGDKLEFSVGVASADFPIDNFYVCPRCGCGLKCKTLDQREDVGNNPLISSI